MTGFKLIFVNLLKRWRNSNKNIKFQIIINIKMWYKLLKLMNHIRNNTIIQKINSNIPKYQQKIRNHNINMY